VTSTQAPIVAVDRFPVDVIAGDSTWREVRLVLTSPVEGVGRLYVWSAPGVTVLDTEFTLADVDIRSKQVEWTIGTTDGPVTVRPRHGCGCGNRLKYWQPFNPMRMGRLR